MATNNSSEQKEALALSTIAFTSCFAVWTIFSIIGLQIRQELNLSETEFGLLGCSLALFYRFLFDLHRHDLVVLCAQER